MIKVLFICHGSICRSPMAEFIFGDLVKKANLEASFLIESAAVSREELGNPVYPPARRVLAAHGIFCGSHRARQITKGDYAAFDYLIGMDRENLSGFRARLRFNDRAASELIDQAVALMAQAKNCHDELETYYRAAVDFDQVNAVAANCQKILGLG